MAEPWAVRLQQQAANYVPETIRYMFEPPQPAKPVRVRITRLGKAHRRRVARKVVGAPVTDDACLPENWSPPRIEHVGFYADRRGAPVAVVIDPTRDMPEVTEEAGAYLAASNAQWARAKMNRT